MRPGRTTYLTLTRRALGTRLAGFAAAIGFGQSAATSVEAQPVSALDPKLRDVALRGLAFTNQIAARYLPKSTNLAIPEKALIDHGLKWWPSKQNESMFAENGSSSQWRLEVTSLVRAEARISCGRGSICRRCDFGGSNWHPTCIQRNAPMAAREYGCCAGCSYCNQIAA